MILAGKVVGLLDLIIKVVNNTAHLDAVEITIFNNNNRKIIWRIEKAVFKESNYMQEAGVIVLVIKREIEKLKVVINIKYSNNKPRPNLSFE